jgi:hypothetical protein
MSSLDDVIGYQEQRRIKKISDREIKEHNDEWLNCIMILGDLQHIPVALALFGLGVEQFKEPQIYRSTTHTFSDLEKVVVSAVQLHEDLLGI